MGITLYAVEMIIRSPGVLAGETRTQLVSNGDLSPTLAELAGAEPPAKPDGRSLVLLLSGDLPARWREAVLLERRGEKLAWAGVSTSRYAHFKYEKWRGGTVRSQGRPRPAQEHPRICGPRSPLQAAQPPEISRRLRRSGLPGSRGTLRIERARRSPWAAGLP